MGTEMGVGVGVGGDMDMGLGLDFGQGFINHDADMECIQHHQHHHQQQQQQQGFAPPGPGLESLFEPQMYQTVGGPY